MMWFKGKFGLIIFLHCIVQSFCLYEDQIGKFDWKRSLIGGVKYAHADLFRTEAKVLVGTEENVVAALNAKNGEIIWRRVLEKGGNGYISFFQYYKDELITVSGLDAVTVRIWDTYHGIINNQYNIILPNSIRNLEKVWFIYNNRLHCISALPNKQIAIFIFDIVNGDQIGDGKYVTVPFTGINIRCAYSSGSVACLDNIGQLGIINLANKMEVISHVLKHYDINRVISPLKSVDKYSHPAFTVATKENVLLIQLKEKEIDVQTVPNAFRDVYGFSLYLHGNRTLLFSTSSSETTNIKLALTAFGSDAEYKPTFEAYSLENTCISEPDILSVSCSPHVSTYYDCYILISSKDKFLAFLKTTMHSSHTELDGKILWSREEALAKIVAVEMVELPISETEAFIQHEFNIKDSGVISMFIRRISSQLFQLQNAIFSLLKTSAKFEDNGKQPLVRDRFNFHKLIIAVTDIGKIFVIDNISKEILWSYYSKNAVAFSQDDTPKALIFVQRIARHFPLPPLCSVILRNKENGHGVIAQFNPLVFKSDEWTYLPYGIIQASLLPAQNEQHLSGIFVIDESYSAHVFPESEQVVIRNMYHSLYFFVAFRETGRIVGLNLNPKSAQNMTLTELWNLETHGTLLRIASKNPLEKVHSQGRVLADRSVLYKYVNPNLIAVVSQHFNDDGKSSLSLFLVDAVTGFVIYSDVHHRATEPVHLVHSENWIVLFYFNDKARRTEAASYELFEGITQKNSTIFSSVDSEVFRPVVDRNAYVVPVSHIDAVKETVTEKGITSKHILVGLGTGSVVEIPWIFLDPRRPSTVTPEMREEGVILYTPEIPIMLESHINYNQTLHRISGIYTTPTSLESTCLVFVYGLDLYYTRVAPSKTFDLLKDDFDYYLIVIVLIILIVATFITKHLAYNKALYQAWR